MFGDNNKTVVTPYIINHVTRILNNIQKGCFNYIFGKYYV